MHSPVLQFRVWLVAPQGVPPYRGIFFPAARVLVCVPPLQGLLQVSNFDHSSITQLTLHIFGHGASLLWSGPARVLSAVQVASMLLL
jgi:hypothetical protein